jgi:DNA-binding LytR/AlgR family response regulator
LINEDLRGPPTAHSSTTICMADSGLLMRDAQSLRESSRSQLRAGDAYCSVPVVVVEVDPCSRDRLCALLAQSRRTTDRETERPDLVLVCRAQPGAAVSVRGVVLALQVRCAEPTWTASVARHAAAQLAGVLAEPPITDQTGGSCYPPRIAVRSIGRIEFVEVPEIEWLQASGNYVEIHTRARSLLHRESLHALEQRLDPVQFLRIHRSVVVNRAAVQEVRAIRSGRVVIVREGRSFRVSRKYRTALDSLARDPVMRHGDR